MCISVCRWYIYIYIQSSLIKVLSMIGEKPSIHKEKILCHIDDCMLQLRSNVALFEQLLRKQLHSVQKINVLCTSSRITYGLWNINSVRWWCCTIAADVVVFCFQTSSVVEVHVLRFIRLHVFSSVLWCLLLLL